MTAIDKFKKIFDKLTEQRGDQWLERIPAWLGDHAGTVATGTAGMINVRTVEGQVLIVFNNVAPSEYNILVTIGRSKDQPQLWQVISRREVWDVPASSSVVHHHQQHMFLAPDMVPIDRKQILALTVLVADPANFIVRMYGSVVHTATGIVKISTQDIDLSSYVVTAGAKFISIETDDDGALTVHEGTAFDAPEIGTYADIPVPAAGKYLIAFVLLYDGQSQLSNNDIRVPFPLGVIAKGSGLQIDEAAADTPADGDKFGFWDIVDDALKSITWANIKATLKTYFDGIYSALGHVHDAADVTYTPAVLADWDGSADPGDVDEALDQLAERVTDISAPSSAFPPGHLFGLTLSNNAGDATNDIDIAIGNARDSTDAQNIVLVGALTKRLDAAWAVGTNQGGLDTGSITNTTYHVWLIKRSDTGVVDVLFSTSATSPSMPTNYDYKRRLGSIVRVGGAIELFTQYDDLFLLSSPVVDVNVSNLGTSSSTYALASVPTGIVVKAVIGAFVWKVANYAAVYVRALTQTDLAAAYNTTANVYDPSNGGGNSNNLEVMTDTSAQIAARSNVTSTNLIVITRGWVDTRGRSS